MTTESNAIVYGREVGALLVARELVGGTLSDDEEEEFCERLDDLHRKLTPAEDAAIERVRFDGQEAERILHAIVDASDVNARESAIHRAKKFLSGK